MTETLPDIKRHATEAAESLRAMNHTMPRVLPAPLLYDLLSELSLMNGRLADALPRLANKLSLSLEELKVYQDDGSDPRCAAAKAVRHMERMQELAEQLMMEADSAKQAIAQQGYRDRFIGHVMS
ncbi:hypothetical protein [Paramicrobacterium fandaimingii]|uniref:hypothetical protein n=1 Tax=Paramicrobacterium fandaimingii TaxID=2708079 RepID=UPI00141D9B6B|nr:hypothetical protein [Microbacterium fandaimingii]